ncbi:MAG TPA: mucin desulfatase [Clostridiales bacterium]|nr:mucin desulfatase [Clostridiales bacterium]
MEPFLKDVLSRFQTEGEAVSCERYGCGHINETYLATTDTGRRYILQKLSNRAFPDIAGLQENIEAVTGHLHSKSSDPRAALTLIPTAAGKSWIHMEENSDWRMYDFVEGSLCLQAPECPEDFYQSAIAFGTFQQQLTDFPAETLHETIRNFHNTPDRYRLFREALEKDVMGRAASVQPEIDFALTHEAAGSKLTAMLRAGELPLRVTHNDTKLNNVMLDAAARTPLCVIDLDTTMPGLSAYDFGDSIRFGAATAAEDEKDLRKMTIDLDLYRIFTRGFLTACPGLTETERKALPLGALTMTLECGVRFLTDYLEGDHYFGIHYPGHNLDRARTQFKLVAEMEGHWDEMARIVEEETKEASD